MKLKNIDVKSTLKGIKADFVAFTKDKEKVKGVITTATLIGLGAVAMNEHNKRTFKKKEETIHDNAYGMGVSVGVVGSLKDVVAHRELEMEEADKAYDRINGSIQAAFEDNQNALNGYVYMTEQQREI